MHYFPLQLAAELNAEDLVYVVIFLIITVGGWVAGWLKKMEEKRQAKRAQQKRELEPPGLSPQETAEPASQRDRLDELAARRRRQIEELRGRRRGGAAARGAAPPTAPQRAEPGNLTMAERIERARAQEQYARRAEELRQQRERAASEARAEAERKRARARAAQERALAAQRRAAEAAARPAPPRPTSTRPAAPIASHAPTVTHLGEASQALQIERTRRGTGRKPRVTQATLRKAIILKEVLDPPLALRPPEQSY